MFTTTFGFSDSLAILLNDWVTTHVTAAYVHAVCAHHIVSTLTVGQLFT